MTASRPSRRLEVVDDPLVVGEAAPSTPAPAGGKRSGGDLAPPTDRAASSKQSQRAPRPPQRRSPPADKAERAAGGVAWEPPALDEQLTLLAARVPASLERALERHAQQLRDEEGTGSQKRLPKQDVVAALLWAAGDPDDPRHKSG